METYSIPPLQLRLRWRPFGIVVGNHVIRDSGGVLAR